MSPNNHPFPDEWFLTLGAAIGALMDPTKAANVRGDLWKLYEEMAAFHKANQGNK